jgi:hypothetical protein
MTTVDTCGLDLDRLGAGALDTLRKVPTGDIYPYAYRPFAIGTKDIRLIQLLPTNYSWRRPNSEQAEIVLRVHQRNVLVPGEDEIANEWIAQTEYAALSYTWGPRTPTRRVYVAGLLKASTKKLDWTYIDIRDNLYQILCHFRDEYAHLDGRTLLWIDQLCINQNDVIERSHQVNFMSRIYKRASYVIAWLGSTSELTKAVKTIVADFPSTATFEERNIALLSLLSSS